MEKKMGFGREIKEEGVVMGECVCSGGMTLDI